jgi:hydroxyethylthiazole kinase
MSPSPDPLITMDEISARFDPVRRHSPLIHHISNYVTLHDCANAAYAVGARPTMAFDPQEAVLAASHADAIVWNLGTFNSQAAAAIKASLTIAAARPIPS